MNQIAHLLFVICICLLRAGNLLVDLFTLFKAVSTLFMPVGCCIETVQEAVAVQGDIWCRNAIFRSLKRLNFKYAIKFSLIYHF